MDIKTVTDLTNLPAFFTQTFNWDIVVSHSDDNGATWSAPHIALDGDPYTITFTPCPVPPFPPGSYCGRVTEPGYAYDKNWVGTHLDEENSNWVHVSATRFDTPGFSNIVSASSGDQGVVWSAPVVHDSGNATTVVQGSRPKGGIGGEVVVVWYHSGTDGWLNGTFQIRTRRSGNFGATWDSRVIAAIDSSELPFWLGPLTFYKRWWGPCFPTSNSTNTVRRTWSIRTTRRRTAPARRSRPHSARQIPKTAIFAISAALAHHTTSGRRRRPSATTPPGGPGVRRAGGRAQWSRARDL